MIVTSADADLLPRLESEEWEGYVHSVFTRAANLVTSAGELITVLEESAPGFPNALYVRGNPGEIEENGHWRCDGALLTFSASGRTLDAGRAKARPMRTLSVPQGAIVKIPLVLRGPGAERKILTDLALALRFGGPWRAQMEMLLGRGEGLTPLGDDMLIGLTGALASFEPLPPYFEAYRDTLAALLPKTTFLSGAYMRFALDGRMAETAVALAEALMEGDAGDISKSLDKLCSWGHTSGSGIAAGLAEGLALAAHPPVPPSPK